MAAWLDPYHPRFGLAVGRTTITAKLPCLQPWAAAAASLLFLTRSVFDNLVATDDLDSACVPWRRREQPPWVRPGPSLHIFWAAVRQALGRPGAARGSTPPSLHPPIHRPRPCFAWVHSAAGRQAAVANNGRHAGSPSHC